MALSYLLSSELLLSLVNGHIVTAPARLPAIPEGVGHPRDVPEHQLNERDILACDGTGVCKCRASYGKAHPADATTQSNARSEHAIQAWTASSDAAQCECWSSVPHLVSDTDLVQLKLQTTDHMRRLASFRHGERRYRHGWLSLLVRSIESLPHTSS